MLWEEYGLVDDCAPFPALWEYAQCVAWGSVRGARALVRGEVDVAVHWEGGRHHAKADQASGYCYVNDVVLALLELRSHYDTVLYVDVDLHHGDGVEQAFLHSPHVVTLSFHHHAPGFFPNTGALESRGLGKGRDRTVNVPLRAGLCDATFQHVFARVLDLVVRAFTPDAVVMVCGADGLAGDPHQIWNLTEASFQHVIQYVLAKLPGKPLLVLGGGNFQLIITHIMVDPELIGGYHSANTARAWCHVMAALLDVRLPVDVPADYAHFSRFGPTFEMAVEPGMRAEENDAQYIASVVDALEHRLEPYKEASEASEANT